MSHASPLEIQLRPSDLRLLGGLAEEVDRQEREDNDLGPEPEGRVRSRVVSTLPSGYEWASRPADPGARVPGGDELRVRALLIRAGVRL